MYSKQDFACWSFAICNDNISIYQVRCLPWLPKLLGMKSESFTLKPFLALGSPLQLCLPALPPTPRLQLCRLSCSDFGGVSLAQGASALAVPSAWDTLTSGYSYESSLHNNSGHSSNVTFSTRTSTLPSSFLIIIWKLLY